MQLISISYNCSHSLAFREWLHLNKMRTKNKLVKSRKHLEWVAINHCCISCGNSEVQIAHIRHLPSGNIGMSVKDDRYCVPLCFQCHQHQHTMNEREFWRRNNLTNPMQFAYQLCLHSPCKKVKEFSESTDYFKEGYNE